MKPQVYIFRIFLSLLVLISVMSFSLFDRILSYDDTEYYNSDSELIFYCRCHSDDNQCYSGNVVSFRSKCYSEPVKDQQVVICHSFDSKCSSEESEPDVEPETEINPL